MAKDITTAISKIRCVLKESVRNAKFKCGRAREFMKIRDREIAHFAGNTTNIGVTTARDIYLTGKTNCVNNH